MLSVHRGVLLYHFSVCISVYAYDFTCPRSIAGVPSGRALQGCPIIVSIFSLVELLSSLNRPTVFGFGLFLIMLRLEAPVPRAFP